MLLHGYKKKALAKARAFFSGKENSANWNLIVKQTARDNLNIKDFKRQLK